MKSRSILTTGLSKGGEYAKRLIASKDKRGTAIGIGKEIGQGLLGKAEEKIHELDHLDVEGDMANPSTDTIDPSEIHEYKDSRGRIAASMRKAMPGMPNRENLPKGVPTFFKEDLGGKTANKDSLISKINQQFAKLGLRITNLIGGGKGVKVIDDIMKQVFDKAGEKIPGNIDDAVLDKVREFVTGVLKYIAKSSNMVALIKAYRLSMIELYLDTMNYLHDHDEGKYNEIVSIDKEWLNLWALSAECFTDTDTVYKYLKKSDQHVKDFVAAITYSETIQLVLFGDPMNPVTGKKWWKPFTSEAIAATKEAVSDGTIDASKKEMSKLNKGKWPYLAEQI